MFGIKREKEKQDSKIRERIFCNNSTFTEPIERFYDDYVGVAKDYPCEYCQNYKTKPVKCETCEQMYKDPNHITYRSTRWCANYDPYTALWCPDCKQIVSEK